MLPFLLHLPHSKLAQAGWPTAVRSTISGIEIPKDEQRLLQRNFADGSTKFVKELVLCFWGGGQWWCIGADAANQSSQCLKLKLQQPFSSLCGWYYGANQTAPNGEAHTMLSDLIRQLLLPEEWEILVPDASEGRESCFLEGDDVHPQPAQSVADYCSLVNVAHFFQIYWEARCHVPHIPSAQLDDSVFSFLLCLVHVYQSTCWEFTLSPMHPVEQADCGGAAPYWLGAAKLEVGGSCPWGLVLCQSSTEAYNR